MELKDVHDLTEDQRLVLAAVKCMGATADVVRYDAYNELYESLSEELGYDGLMLSSLINDIDVTIEYDVRKRETMEVQ